MPDEVYRKEFTEGELADLSYAVMAIQAWNRMAIWTPAVPGECRPAEKKTSAATWVAFRRLHCR